MSSSRLLLRSIFYNLRSLYPGIWVDVALFRFGFGLPYLSAFILKEIALGRYVNSLLLAGYIPLNLYWLKKPLSLPNGERPF